MFDVANNAVVKVDNVISLNWKSESCHVNARKYSSLTFRIRGKAEITCQGKTFSFDENGILYIPQNLSYDAKYNDTEVLVIHFYTLYDDHEAHVINLKDRDSIYKMFLEAYHLWQEKRLNYPLYTTAQLYKILANLIELKEEKEIPSYFSNAISYINAHYKDESLTVREICIRAGISGTALRILFKRYYNMTPIAYITKLKTDHAKLLIADGHSVKEAAQKCGFRDSKYFARVVKKIYSCHPSDFKNYGK